VTSVLDASSVVAYLLGQGTETERAGMLGDAHAPELLDVQATHTLRGLLRAGKLELETAELARAELCQTAIRRHRDQALLARAWELRENFTIYDALYVALAEALEATLITRDAGLAKAVDGLVKVAGPGGRSRRRR
jgi:predicted nucleic acid-binding protein